MNFLIKIFIKDYQCTSDSNVRVKIGQLVSVVSIFLNILLAVTKLVVGIFANSISIQADAYNNFSDVGSNFATLIGFKLANKHPDTDHPYGHGRAEYISGLVISFMIILIGLQSAKEAIFKIIYKSDVNVSLITVIALILSIFVKLYMGYINNNIGKKIDSTSLKAAAKDSYNDVLSTFATLVSVMMSMFLNINIDGWIGLGVSIIVLRTGYGVFQDTILPLLGQAPKKEVVEAIEQLVMNYDGVTGIHDFIMHDYGPGRSFVTLHAEVDASENILVIHDQIDLAEREILEVFNIHATIHLDPVNYNDETVVELRSKVSDIVFNINEVYTIHDFRIVKGSSHTNVLFDVVIPIEDRTNEIELKKLIDSKIKEINSDYNTVIDIDRTYY